MRARAARSRAARRAPPASSAASPEASLARSENSLYLSIQAVKRKTTSVKDLAYQMITTSSNLATNGRTRR